LTTAHATDHALVDRHPAQSQANPSNARLVEVDVDTTTSEQSHRPGVIAWSRAIHLAWFGPDPRARRHLAAAAD
jgi:hypothetical protein